MKMIKEFSWFFNRSKSYMGYDELGIVGKIMFFWNVPFVFYKFYRLQRISDKINS